MICPTVTARVAICAYGHCGLFGRRCRQELIVRYWAPRRIGPPRCERILTLRTRGVGIGAAVARRLRLRPYEAVCRRLRGKVGVSTARELEGLCLRAEQSGAPGLAARAELAEVRRAAERLVDGAVAELQAAWGAAWGAP